MIESIVPHVWESIAVFAIGIGLYFFKKYNAQIEDKVSRFIERVSAMLKSNESKQLSLTRSLNTHSENMGKATKAINGDMLAIKNSIFSLKKELNDELQKVQNQSSEIARGFETLATRFELASEAFDQRYGRLINLELRTQNNEGKILLIEKQNGNFALSTSKNRTEISANKEKLDRVIENLRQLRADKRKLK